MADVTRNETRSRYEAHEDGALAGFVAYRDAPDVVTLTRTEVGDEFGGRGIAGDLVRFALDDVRASGRFVRPECEFAADWIKRNPEYSDLVSASWT